MTSASLPADFNWVNARAACSLPVVFKELQLGVQNDIQTMESLAAGQARFSITALMRGRFSVVRDEKGFPDSVTFALENGAITVRDDENAVIATATVTLNDKGECKLKTGTDELEQWQFRRRTLEKLFFGPRSL